jgi:heme/copper-type cytochrome/quinol oxidase subunit 4
MHTCSQQQWQMVVIVIAVVIIIIIINKKLPLVWHKELHSESRGLNPAN